jgi:hypothetical protein
MNKTKIKDLIERKQDKFFQFKPSVEFYIKVSINRKRWGQIHRGEIEPTITEAKAIADFFHFDVSELFEN